MRIGRHVYIENPEAGAPPVPPFHPWPFEPVWHRTVIRLAVMAESQFRFAAFTEAKAPADQQLACDARALAAAYSRQAFEVSVGGRDLNRCYYCDDSGMVVSGSLTSRCSICNGTKHVPIAVQMPLFCTLCNGTCRFQ